MQPNPDPSWLSKNHIYFCYVGVKINCQRASPACPCTSRCEIQTRCSSSISLQYMSHMRLNVGTSPPPAESKTEAINRQDYCQNRAAPNYELLHVVHFLILPVHGAASPALSPARPSLPLTSSSISLAPRLTYYCNVNAGKHPTTGRSASGD